jgi:predicted ATPase
MILKALTLENFKGIREPVRIEFAPLTLLFGPNNAGKSTIVQALMYAREVLERNNCDVGRTVLGGDVVDLGGFDNLVYGHDRSRVIRMRFELDLSQATRHDAESIREDEITTRIYDFYRNAPKDLDIQSAARLSDNLVEIWVQIKVAWSEPQKRPVVRAYSVGTGSTEYAEIAFDEEKEDACLSHFNCGIYPFGTRYEKGDLTDFEWALEKEVRWSVRRDLWNRDQDGMKTNKSTQIALAEDDVTESETRITRARFDQIVNRIVAGDGEYGDPSVDTETGKQNPYFLERERLINYVRPRVTPKASSPPLVVHVDIDIHSVSSSSPSKQQNASTQERCWNDWQFFLEHLFDEKDHEIDGWMLEFFAALIEEDYIADFSIPLRQRDSAVPQWGKTLQPDSHVWIRDECNQFWEYPMFAQEFFKELLTTAIVNPGQELLRALQQAVYLSPFRRLPSRGYRTESLPAPQSWASGLAAWDLLLRGSDDSLRMSVSDWLTSRDRFNTKYRVVAKRRKSLDVDGDFWKSLVSGEIETGSEDLLQQLENLLETSKLELQHVESGLILAPQDLGTGISQVIPVIVAALSDPSGQASRLVMIEEPEANIHPAFQVVLADLFLTQAKENSASLFLIETHSEHLMLRVMRRIRESYHGKQHGGLAATPADVSILFVEREADRTLVRPMPLNEAGELVKAWPGGFFEEGLKEQFGDD